MRSCPRLFLPVVQIYEHLHMIKFVSLYLHTSTIRMSGFLPFFPLTCILSCRNPDLIWHVHFEWTYSLVPSRVYCSSGVELGLLVRLEKSLLERGSPLKCVVRDKTHVCWDIVGWAPTQGSQGVFGAFIHCHTCDKNKHWHLLPVLGTWCMVTCSWKKTRAEIRSVSLHNFGLWFLVCYATTQLAVQLHIQVLYSNRESRKRPAESINLSVCCYVLLNWYGGINVRSQGFFTSEQREHVPKDSPTLPVRANPKFPASRGHKKNDCPKQTSNNPSGSLALRARQEVPKVLVSVHAMLRNICVCLYATQGYCASAFFL